MEFGELLVSLLEVNLTRLNGRGGEEGRIGTQIYNLYPPAACHQSYGSSDALSYNTMQLDARKMVLKYHPKWHRKYNLKTEWHLERNCLEL